VGKNDEDRLERRTGVLDPDDAASVSPFRSVGVEGAFSAAPFSRMGPPGEVLERDLALSSVLRERRVEGVRDLDGAVSCSSSIVLAVLPCRSRWFLKGTEDEEEENGEKGSLNACDNAAGGGSEKLCTCFLLALPHVARADCVELGDVAAEESVLKDGVSDV